MKRTRSVVPAPRPKRPLEEEMERLANEVRVLRDVLDELRTEIQWANRNRRCEPCRSNADPPDSSASSVRDEQCDSGEDPENAIHPPIRHSGRPTVMECVAPRTRAGDRLF